MSGTAATCPAWNDALPAEAGFDPDHLAAALEFARRRESDWPRDMYLDGRYIACVHVDDQPPYDQPMGPVVPRGGTSGLILRGGRLVAEWGDTRRPEMTFSIAKSYLALLAGVAAQRGLLPDLDAPVRESVGDDLFRDANGAITWRHLLQQTSEWQGTLFERPDSVDWNRQVATGADPASGVQKGSARRLHPPGTHFEYNDVRVNLLGLCLLRLFRRPLPEVLREAVMVPLGCSADWRWHGYDTSWVTIDGKPMQSVPGGGHWGGGLVISARDHARVGELVLNRGIWAGRRLLPETWVEQMLTPSAANPAYGLLWWLNPDRRLFATAPETSVYALGGGMHVIWLDRQLDLVVVLRWVRREAFETFIKLLMAAMTHPSGSPWTDSA